MSIASTGRIAFGMNVGATTSKLEVVNNNQPEITFDSLDIPNDVIQSQFKQAVKSVELSKQEIQKLRDQKKQLQMAPKSKEEIQAQRELKKFEQLAKKAAIIKAKEVKVNNANVVVLPVEKRLKSDEVANLRFSQDSIQSTTSDKSKTLDELAQDMKVNGWKKGTSLVLVKMPDDSLVSMNNRRLFAAKKVSLAKADFEVPVSIFKHNDPAPKKLLRGIVSEYGKIQKGKDVNKIANQILQDSYGHAITLRINTRKGDLANSEYGYVDAPSVRTQL